MNPPSAYPLSWPASLARYPAARREAGTFRTHLKGALENVRQSLTLFGKDAGKPVSGITLSSNVSLGEEAPADPGVAVWFMWEDQQFSIAVDRYRKPEANLQAIHHIIEARRVELRHGTLNLVRASMQGFLSLPAPPGSHWTDILQLPANASGAQIDAAFKMLAREAHPDRTRDDGAKMAALTAARAQALNEAPEIV